MKLLSITTTTQIRENLSVLSLTLMFVALGLQVIACSCRPPAPLTMEEFLNADLVFEGKALSVETDKEQGMKVITFEVTKAHKTPRGTTKIEVTTAGNSAACGLTIEEGQNWYIWARKNEETGAYSSGICSRSLYLAEDASKKYFQRYEEEMELIQSVKSKRGKQRLEVSTGTAEGKMKKGRRCGKWRYYAPDGTLTKTCRYKRGIEVSCIENNTK